MYDELNIYAEYVVNGCQIICISKTAIMIECANAKLGKMRVLRLTALM